LSGVWGESHFGIEKTCYEKKTHAEAELICSQHGGRLYQRVEGIVHKKELAAARIRK